MCLELLALVGEKIFKQRLQNRILLPLKVSFQKVRRDEQPRPFYMRVPPRTHYS